MLFVIASPLTYYYTMYMLPDIDPFCSAVGLDEDMLVTTIPLNYYTTSLMLQEVAISKPSLLVEMCAFTLKYCCILWNM